MIRRQQHDLDSTRKKELMKGQSNQPIAHKDPGLQ